MVRNKDVPSEDFFVQLLNTANHLEEALGQCVCFVVNDTA